MVKIESTHSCIENRGIRQKGSSTVTMEADGEFKAETQRATIWIETYLYNFT